MYNKPGESPSAKAAEGEAKKEEKKNDKKGKKDVEEGEVVS